jgi:hypothetical protein
MKEELTMQRPTTEACSLELSAAYLQLASSVFLSQQIRQQYFQPLIFSQANKPVQ